LSATKAACESRAIGFPFNVAVAIFEAHHTVIEDEPDMKNTAKVWFVG
jgi:hypothetical protein